jgi:threonine/homoserine/homoserine lactone efflux protein
MLVFIQGVVLGFSIAAPVGPIGVLCIRRTLAKGMIAGLISGLGAATADAIYGIIAICGVSALSVVLLEYKTYLHFVGGTFLLYMGYIIFKALPASVEAVGGDSTETILRDYVSTVFLTLTNPMTIFSFAAILAGLDVETGGARYLAPALLVGGVFIGSMFWWLCLSVMVNLLRSNFSRSWLKVVNQISGLIIIGFGIFSLSNV